MYTLQTLSHLYARVLTAEQEVSTALSAANGRRRIRTLDAGYIYSAARRAYDNNLPVFLHAGTVANSYGYRSYTTVARCVPIGNGIVAVEIRQISAAKGCSGFGRRDWPVDADTAIQSADALIMF